MTLLLKSSKIEAHSRLGRGARDKDSPSRHFTRLTEESDILLVPLVERERLNFLWTERRLLLMPHVVEEIEN
jgi:hypothetical protein